jgi:competence protein ComGC
MHRSPSQKCQRGVTLGETLFICALIVVGCIVLWFVESRTRADSAVKSCGTNVHQLGAALAMYALDHDGDLPQYTNMERVLAKSGSAPTTSDQPALLKRCLQLYCEDNTWYCPIDPVKGKAVYYLGIRHQFTSYVFPNYSVKGKPQKLEQLANDVQHGLLFDAAGTRSESQGGSWLAGSQDWASNHSDGSVNYVASDLSLHHADAKSASADLLP